MKCDYFLPSEIDLNDLNESIFFFEIDLTKTRKDTKVRKQRKNIHNEA